MLTPQRRALFEASYSALLLRGNPGDRPQPAAPGRIPQADQPRPKPDGNLRSSAEPGG